jgi:hypothetical protein
VRVVRTARVVRAPLHRPQFGIVRRMGRAATSQRAAAARERQQNHEEGSGRPTGQLQQAGVRTLRRVRAARTLFLFQHMY